MFLLLVRPRLADCSGARAPDVVAPYWAVGKWKLESTACSTWGQREVITLALV
jgi:hypothetical protein